MLLTRISTKMAKPKIVKGRGHVTAENDDRASLSLPKFSPAKKSASSSGSTEKLPAPSKPNRAKAGGGVSGASRSTKGKTTTAVGTAGGGSSSRAGRRSILGESKRVSGASRSTAGKVSEKSGASRSTAGKVKSPSLIEKIRKTLSDGASGGFLKKYRNK